MFALATLAATTAFAQTTDGKSGVQITGNMNAGIVSQNYFGNKVSGFEQNGMGTSVIFIRAQEDLGDGWNAHLLHGSDWQFMTNQGDAGVPPSGITTAAAVGSAAPVTSVANAGSKGTFGNDMKLVGLTTPYGTVNFGTINNQSLYGGTVLLNPQWGTSYAGGYGSVNCADPTCGYVRYDNTAEYKSPVLSGFQLFGQMAQKQNLSTTNNWAQTLGLINQPAMTEISAKYSQGPFVAQVTRLDTDATGTGTAGTFSSTAGLLTGTASAKKSLTTAVAAYQLGDLRFGALYQTVLNPTLLGYGLGNDTTKSSDRTATQVNAIYTFGVNTIVLNAGQSKENNALKTLGGGKTSKFTSIGYKYALSKMTSLEAKYENLDDAAFITTMPTQFGSTRTSNTRVRSTLGLNMNF